MKDLPEPTDCKMHKFMSHGRACPKCELQDMIGEIEDVATGIDLVACDVSDDGRQAARLRLGKYSARLKKLAERLSSNAEIQRAAIGGKL